MTRSCWAETGRFSPCLGIRAPSHLGSGPRPAPWTLLRCPGSMTTHLWGQVFLTTSRPLSVTAAFSSSLLPLLLPLPTFSSFCCPLHFYSEMDDLLCKKCELTTCHIPVIPRFKSVACSILFSFLCPWSPRCPLCLEPAIQTGHSPPPSLWSP